MDIANIELAVKTRLQADTGSGGLLNSSAPLITGVWVSNAPAGNTAPYCVIDVASEKSDNAFTKDIYSVEFWVHTFVARHGNATPLQTASDIMARIFGDSAAGAVPSYGLHRHPLSLSGSWTATNAECTGAFAEHDENVYHYYQIFRLTVSK